MREQSTGAQGTVNLGEGEQTALAETPFTDGQDLENRMLVALRLRVYKATELRPKADPPLHRPSPFASLVSCGLMVSAGEEHPFKVLQLPAPSASVFLVLAQHITPLTVLIQTC